MEVWSSVVHCLPTVWILRGVTEMGQVAKVSSSHLIYRTVPNQIHLKKKKKKKHETDSVQLFFVLLRHFEPLFKCRWRRKAGIPSHHDVCLVTVLSILGFFNLVRSLQLNRG